MTTVMKTSTGESVEVHVDGFGIEVPCRVEPPHTAVLEPAARIDRGSNFHGSLAEWFYVTANQGSEWKAWVLWLGDNGSQNDDDVGRLLPVAYCFRHQGSDEYLELEDAAPVLMEAYAAWMRGNYEGHYDDEMELRGSELIPDEVLARAFKVSEDA